MEPMDGAPTGQIGDILSIRLSKDSSMLQTSGNRNPCIHAINRCASRTKKGSFSQSGCRGPTGQSRAALEVGLTTLQPQDECAQSTQARITGEAMLRGKC